VTTVFSPFAASSLEAAEKPKDLAKDLAKDLTKDLTKNPPIGALGRLRLDRELGFVLALF